LSQCRRSVEHMFDRRSSSIWDSLDFGSPENLEADELRTALLADEAEISKIRGRQVERLRRADRLQLDTADGSRTMADWVVANLDVSPQTARRMMRIVRGHHSDIEQRMEAGEFGIDRAAFLCQIRDLDGPEELIADSGRYSLGHLYGVIDRLRKIDSLTEQLMFEDRYMALQPSLDRSSGRFWGQTHGTDWHIIERALTRRESQLPGGGESDPGATESRRLRHAVYGLADHNWRRIRLRSGSHCRRGVRRCRPGRAQLRRGGGHPLLGAPGGPQHPLRDPLHGQGPGHRLRRRWATDRCIRPRRDDPARRPQFRPTA